MKKVFTLSLLGLLFFSCKQDLNSGEQKMYDEVMVIHDDVMPKTRDIRQQQNTLEQLQDKLEKDEDKIAVRKALANLEKADEMMFEWMGAFKKKNALPEGTDYTAYLNEEKIKIQAVSDAMLSSIEEADELIKKLNNE